MAEKDPPQAQIDIDHLALLSRLHLSPELKKKLSRDLLNIVGYVESLQKVDVDGVEPMTHAIAMDQRRRKDAAQDGVGTRGLSGSAGLEGDLIRVPRIVE
jgi:aspartyl-tRNA(Asn)/glutamyl-tRNA(Gln) amidotransferase subunit C